MSYACCDKCSVVSRKNNVKCMKARIFGTGSIEVLFVLPFPEYADDINRSPYSGERSKFVLKYINKIAAGRTFAVTCLTKCFPYDSKPSGGGAWGRVSTPRPRELRRGEIENCSQILVEEINNLNPTRVQTIGKSVFEFITGSSDKYLNRIGGAEVVSFAGTTIEVVPNFDPHQLFRQGNLVGDFKRNIENAFSGVKKYNPDPHVRVLNPTQALEKIDECIKLFNAGKITHIYYDIENSVSLWPWEGGEIITHGFAHDFNEETYAIPTVINNNVQHETDVEFSPIPWDVTEQQKKQIDNKIGEMLRLIPIVGHNAKYDLKWLIWKEIIKLEDVKVKADTLTMAFMVCSVDDNYGLGLEDLSIRILNADPWEKAVKGYLGKFRLTKDRHYGNIPSGLVNPYCCKDIFWTRELYRHFNKKFSSEYAVSSHVLHVFTNLIKVFLEVETRGVAVDESAFGFLDSGYLGIKDDTASVVYNLSKVRDLIQPKIDALLQANEKKKKKLTENEIYKSAFSFGSSPMMQKVMYEVYGLPKLPKFTNDSGSMQTGKEVIDHFLYSDLSEKKELSSAQKEAREFLKSVKVWKRIDKLYSSYIDPLSSSSHNWIYRPDYNLNKVVTGRMSSSFHSMPNRCDIKRLYTSRWKKEGGLILAADQSQLELRIVASVANEKKFIDAFKRGDDPHRNTAAIVYNRPLSEVTSVQRQVGKTVNFAVLYMMQAKTLAEDLSIKEEEAQSILNRFYAGAHNLKRWQADQTNYMLEHGYITTKFGRILPIKCAFSSVEWEKAEAVRHACNYAIQSFQFDVPVCLCSGEVVKIGELAKRSGPFHLYAYDHKSRRITVAKATKAFMSHSTTEWLKIAIDNGEVIEVTPEHQFMLRDGSYLEASRLKVGQSLMPFNKRIASKSRFRRCKAEYLEVEQVNKECDKWELVHRIVNEKYNQIPKELGSLCGTSGIQTHHIDGNSLNNDPSNLEWLGISDHFKKHADIGSKNAVRKEKYPKWYENQRTQAGVLAKRKLAETGNTLGMDHDKFIELQLNRSKEHQQKINESIKKVYNTEEMKRENSERRKQDHSSVKYVLKFAGNHIKWFNKMEIPYHTTELWDIACFITGIKNPSVKNMIRYSSFFTKVNGAWDEIRNLSGFFVFGVPTHHMAWNTFLKHNHDRYKRRFVEVVVVHALSGVYLTKEELIDKVDGSRDITHFSELDWKEIYRDSRLITNNHKIVSVEKVVYDVPQPAYDIEVPGYHNFALSSGIFVHNSSAADVVSTSVLDLFEAVKKMRMNSLLVGCVHDSIEYDVYPGDLIRMVKLYKKMCMQKPSEVYDWLVCPLELTFEIGSSWGGALESHVEHIDDSTLVFTTSGLRKDIRMLELVASRAYNIKVDVLGEKELSSSSFADDVLYRDSIRQDVRFHLGYK